MPYQALSDELGRIYFPNVRSIFVMNLEKANYFVEPWDNHVLRDCATFCRDTTNTHDEVLLFVREQEIIDLLNSSNTVYLFGAYGQITVMQIRATCSVSRVDDQLTIEATRALIRAKIGLTTAALGAGEIARRHILIDNGSLFRFRIHAYAHSTYQRG